MSHGQFEGGGGGRIHVDTRYLKSAKNILKYLYFHKICPPGQSTGGEVVRQNFTVVHKAEGGVQKW